MRINLYDIITISCGPKHNIIRNGDLCYLQKDDLCYKAAVALKQKSNCNLGCSVTLKKRIPIGKGGMILTNDKKAYEWFKMMRYEGRNTDIPYVKDTLRAIGYNMYMLPEDAARGLILMNKIPRQNDDTGGSDNYTDLREQRIFDDFLENS